MRSFTLVGAAAVAAVLGVASSAAAQGNLVPKPGGAFTPVPRQSNPLFQNDRVDKLKEETRRRLQAQKPKLECGMTVFPITPDVDPKSIKPAPTDKKYTMRNVPRPMCGQESSTAVVPPPTVAPR
jgi:hypothetical protein